MVDTLEAALWCFGTTDSLEAALLTAANLGDDCDTVAAITGQLAGCDYGVNAHGYSMSKRSVERDLASLAETFPQAIHCQEQQGQNGRTSYWHLTSLKGLLPETLINNNDAALALTLLKQQAYNRLPRGVFNRLESL